jgi:8-oxo-dGTP diphosphatase
MNTADKEYEYVCGFAFVNDRVLLSEKKRPTWQAGRLNGVGGHIKEGEYNLQAMRREFQEETGVIALQWYNFATLKSPHFSVHFFYTEADPERLSMASDHTDEHLRWVLPEQVTIHNAIPNLTWLIPMARNLRHEISPRKAIRIELTEIYG